jgi:hypothetical protein
MAEIKRNLRYLEVPELLDITYCMLKISTSIHVNQGASAAVNAIILLEIFLYPKRLIYLYFLIPIPAAFMV